jgi:hypothetical protein
MCKANPGLHAMLCSLTFKTEERDFVQDFDICRGRVCYGLIFGGSALTVYRLLRKESCCLYENNLDNVYMTPKPKLDYKTKNKKKQKKTCRTVANFSLWTVIYLIFCPSSKRSTGCSRKAETPPMDVLIIRTLNSPSELQRSCESS